MEHDYEILNEVINLSNGKMLITGSFIVSPENAKDIDIVLVDIESKLLEERGYERRDNEYHLNKDRTLLSVWRKNNYNLIVVKNNTAFLLWKAATKLLVSSPWDYEDKSDRTYMFDNIKSVYEGN